MGEGGHKRSQKGKVLFVIFAEEDLSILLRWKPEGGFVKTKFEWVEGMLCGRLVEEKDNAPIIVKLLIEDIGVLPASAGLQTHGRDAAARHSFPDLGECFCTGVGNCVPAVIRGVGGAKDFTAGGITYGVRPAVVARNEGSDSIRQGEQITIGLQPGIEDQVEGHRLTIRCRWLEAFPGARFLASPIRRYLHRASCCPWIMDCIQSRPDILRRNRLKQLLLVACEVPFDYFSGFWFCHSSEKQYKRYCMDGPFLAPSPDN